MGEIAINPIHNVYKKYRTMNLVNPYIIAPPVDLTTNTEIGGVAAKISTPALLATKLGINVSRITNFTIVGSDIKCKISGSYAIPGSAFQFNTNPSTYYRDTDGLVTAINDAAFYAMDVVDSIKRTYDFKNTVSVIFAGYKGAFRRSNAEFIFLENCINVSQDAFSENKYLKKVYIPRATNLGNSVANNDVFSLIPTSCIIYCHPSLATNNGGAPDGDIAYAISQGATVRYVTNFTAPNPVTNLTAGTIYNSAVQLNFTAPTGSTNAIEYYECYANGVLKNTITASGQYITGLTQNTNYNITLKSVDIFYNKSVVSNSLSVSTNTIDFDSYNYINASGNQAYETAIVALFTDLKSQGLYNKIQAFYPFLGTTAAQHKWNAKNPLDTNAAFRLQFFGGGTHSNLGYQCNGTNAYAITYFNSSLNQNINNNGLTIVCGTNNTKNDAIEIGCYTGSNVFNFLNIKRYTTNGERSFLSAGIFTTQTGEFEARGIFTGSKTTQNNAKLYRNNTVVATTTTGVVGSLPNLNVYIGALNINGPYAYSPQRIQFTAIHEGLSDSEVTMLHTIIDNFESAIGRKTW